MTYVRIAPSPTGYLHVGNIRTALVNFLFARKTGGTFLLRLDDTDSERSRPEYAAAIEEDLRWLGMEWDSFAKQSDRLGDYETAKQKLIASGRLYPCFETQEELDIKRKMLAGRGLPPVYDRAALKLTEAQKQLYEKEGKKPHWRFLLDGKDIKWNDLVRGPAHYQSDHLSDPVLIRADGVPLYTLASVVDDGDMGITHVIRGEDHVTNTAVQIQIFEALGYKVPEFAHLALLKTREGELSKRTGGGDIRSLRAAGMLPMAINSLLAKIGTSDAVEPFTDMAALVASFDIGKFGRAPATYDPTELERLNAKLLATTQYAEAEKHLQALGIGGINAALWHAIRGNISAFTEAAEWQTITEAEGTFIQNNKEFLSQAATHLPPEPWDETTWSTWTSAVKTATGKKGKELFLPLRLALTGREDGPELKALLPLIGYKKALKRLVS